MSDEIKKSDSIKIKEKNGEKASTYDSTANIERKAKNTGVEFDGMGPNRKEKPYTNGGKLTAKQQAAADSTPARVKALSGPVKTFSDEEKKKMQASLTPPSKMKKDEMLEVEPDGKRELVEGKEPLKKDPKKRWASLKKALHHDKAFMNLEEAMGDDEESKAQQQPQEGGAEDLQQQIGGEGGEEQEEQPEQDDQGEGDGSPLEAVSEGQEGEEEQPQEDEGQPQEGEEEEQPENPEEGNGDVQPDPQELMDALKAEGHSDQEIAYIMHGHHAAEVDPTKAAKADATRAMSDVELGSAQKAADLEHQHNEQSLAAERDHKKRMSDLEFEQAQKKHALVDQDAQHKQRMSDVEYEQAQQNNPAQMESAHKQRMLDLEYEKAKKETSQSDGSEGDAEANKQMKLLEVEQKKLELALRKEEMKMELEFKKREHELKLKMMEVQLKEQAKQKQEIGGIKHEQKLADAKKPPAKKPLKKSEEGEDDE